MIAKVISPEGDEKRTIGSDDLQYRKVLMMDHGDE